MQHRDVVSGMAIRLVKPEKFLLGHLSAEDLFGTVVEHVADGGDIFIRLPRIDIKIIENTQALRFGECTRAVVDDEEDEFECGCSGCTRNHLYVEADDIERYEPTVDEKITSEVKPINYRDMKR